MRDESLYPLSEHALHRTLRTPPSQPLQAKKPASRFHALVLIGVAAAFRAAVSAHPTKPIVASELAEANYPAAFPPQWLPVLLATASTSGLPLPIEPYLPNPGCAARYAVNESFPRGNVDAAWGNPGSLSLYIYNLARGMRDCLAWGLCSRNDARWSSCVVTLRVL